MGKGYNLERSCVWYFRNQGIFAIRLHTRQQIKEFSKIDVIVFNVVTGELIFIQCKAGRRPYMSQSDKLALLQVSFTYGAKALLCYKEKGKMRFQYLQSKTKFRPKTKISQYK